MRIWKWIAAIVAVGVVGLVVWVVAHSTSEELFRLAAGPMIFGVLWFVWTIGYHAGLEEGKKLSKK